MLCCALLRCIDSSALLISWSACQLWSRVRWPCFVLIVMPLDMPVSCCNSRHELVWCIVSNIDWLIVEQVIILELIVVECSHLLRRLSADVWAKSWRPHVVEKFLVLNCFHHNGWLLLGDLSSCCKQVPVFTWMTARVMLPLWRTVTLAVTRLGLMRAWWQNNGNTDWQWLSNL
jgi:hypothetical protein